MDTRLKETGGLDQARGLAFALVLGVVGFLTPIAFSLAITGLRWTISGADDFDRRFDLSRLSSELPGPVLATSFVFGATGWACQAPRGSYSFTRTLIIIFAACVPSWFLLVRAIDSLDPRTNVKGRFEVSPVEATLAPTLALPAVVSALILARVRAGRQPPDGRKGPPDPELA